MVMTQKHSHLSGFGVLAVLMIVIFSGCRTYGGYGSEAALFEQIEESNTVFVNDLEKARGELQKLEQAAQQNSEMNSFVTEYKMLLEKHGQMVDEHAHLVAELDVQTGFIGQLTPSYRNLNRALGYIAAEQAAMKGHYYRLAAQIDGSLYADGDIWQSNISRSRYQAVPPFYQVIAHALERKSISGVLSESL